MITKLIILSSLLVVFGCSNDKKCNDIDEIEQVVEYYDNGDIELIYHLNACGDLHGDYSSFYYDSVLKYIGKFENGLKTGLHIRYLKSGSILSKKHYKNDKLQGDYIKFNMQGDTVSHVIFENGHFIKHVNGMGEQELLNDSMEKLNKYP